MNWNNEKNKKLAEAVLALETLDETKRFLSDLMTPKEIEEIGKRLQAAKMLTEKISYSKIEKETGLSSTTIARVSKWANNESGGYKKIMSKLHTNPSLTKKGLI